MKNKPVFILIGFLVIVAFFLIFEHRVHLYAVVPYAFFVIFIGLHFFMHSGHSGHGDKRQGGHKHG